MNNSPDENRVKIPDGVPIMESMRFLPRAIHSIRLRILMTSLLALLLTPSCLEAQEGVITGSDDIGVDGEGGDATGSSDSAGPKVDAEPETEEKPEPLCDPDTHSVDWTLTPIILGESMPLPDVHLGETGSVLNFQTSLNDDYFKTGECENLEVVIGISGTGNLFEIIPDTLWYEAAGGGGVSWSVPCEAYGDGWDKVCCHVGPVSITHMYMGLAGEISLSAPIGETLILDVQEFNCSIDQKWKFPVINEHEAVEVEVVE